MKAKRFLESKNVEFSYIDAKDGIKLEDIKSWYDKSGLSIDKFFNTSGKVYKELALKEKIKSMDLDEKLNLLVSNGMLVKRPILVLDNSVLVGFKEEEWEKALAS